MRPFVPLAAAVALALGGGAVLLGSDPAALAISQARTADPAQAIASAYEREGPSGTRGLVGVSGDGADEGLGTRVRTSVKSGRARADASARAEDVNLFDGLVTADRVETSATATGGSTQTFATVIDLRIDGRAVESPTRGGTYPLGRYGSLVVGKEGDRGVAGLRARLKRAYNGHPAGSVITVAYSSARARDGDPPADEDAAASRAARAERRRKANAARERRDARERRAARRREAGRDARARRVRPARRRPAPAVQALRTARGYAFPVHARYSYSNDWGAPRRHTGTHQGTDVFAATGTPVLAVTSGRLSRVGTRAVPGNRMWLKSDEGDAFFYGHLSAFSEEARNGAQVTAGDVIGFVGSTGDAEQTPPHLHFEVHPGARAPVNPYPFLRAWDARRDVPPAAWLERYGADPGARAGALVVIDDYLAP